MAEGQHKVSRREGPGREGRWGQMGLVQARMRVQILGESQAVLQQ